MKKYIEKEVALKQIQDNIQNIKIELNRTEEDLSLAKNIYRLTEPAFNAYSINNEGSSSIAVKKTIDKVLLELGYSEKEVELLKYLYFYETIKGYIEDSNEIYIESFSINACDEADFVFINDGTYIISYMIGSYKYAFELIRK